MINFRLEHEDSVKNQTIRRCVCGGVVEGRANLLSAPAARSATAAPSHLSTSPQFRENSSDFTCMRNYCRPSGVLRQQHHRTMEQLPLPYQPSATGNRHDRATGNAVQY